MKQRHIFLPLESERQTAGIDAVVYSGTQHGSPVAQGFSGKRSKHDFYLRFGSETSMDIFINEYFTKLIERKKNKDERRESAKSFVHTLKVGDILYSSWGYDQTNIDFYQVTQLVGSKKVKLAAIHSRKVDSDTNWGADSALCTAHKDNFCSNEEPQLKLVLKGNTIRLTTYSSAWVWDGQPKRYSWGA